MRCRCKIFQHGVKKSRINLFLMFFWWKKPWFGGQSDACPVDTVSRSLLVVRFSQLFHCPGGGCGDGDGDRLARLVPLTLTSLPETLMFLNFTFMHIKNCEIYPKQTSDQTNYLQFQQLSVSQLCKYSLPCRSWSLRSRISEEGFEHEPDKGSYFSKKLNISTKKKRNNFELKESLLKMLLEEIF